MRHVCPWIVSHQFDFATKNLHLATLATVFYHLVPKWRLNDLVNLEPCRKTSDWFEVRGGVKQGCVMSGFTFIIVIDWVMRKMLGKRTSNEDWPLQGEFSSCYSPCGNNQSAALNLSCATPM